MIDDPSDDRGSLVARGDKVPAVPLARSLQTAPQRSFVHVDRKGQVRSPARLRALQALDYGLIGAAVALPVVYTVALGPLFGLAGLVATATAAWRVAATRRIKRGASLLVHDRLDEAEAALAPLLRRGRAPRRLRALAAQNLGACSARRGDHAAALDRQREAIRLHGRSRSPLAISVRYAEIYSLANLGRTGEARDRLAERGPAPAGDYLRVMHWGAELYLALAEGRHTLDEPELHERARVALGITSSSALLGLLAWAHHHAGDTDQAWHLLGEALDRVDMPLDRVMPRLAAWMEDHRAEAEAARADLA
jgi:tetratricopeptide (TPR) repeat protein